MIDKKIKRLSKKEKEEIFVNQIISSGGVDKCYEMDERGNTYHQFNIKNGDIRYWTNLSEDSKKKLDIL